MKENLLNSRINKDISPSRLKNLSPDKYGKAAWADLAYTPCKLADNVIYREVTTMKKNEEGNNKLRQFEAMNGFMREKLNQLQLERDGIEKSLSQQIGMYKKMLQDAENKHQIRLKEMQKRFNSEIQMIIIQKEEQAKFSQAEQEILEARIQQLEEKLRESEGREDHIENEYKNINSYKEKLEIELEHLKQNLCKLEKERAVEQDEWKRHKDDQNRKSNQTEKTYQDQIQNLMNQKNRDKESMERIMKTELEKAQNIRMNEGLRKSQQMRDIMLTFQNQTKRLNQIIAMKDRMLQNLTIENAKNKQNLVQITANYEGRLNNLTHNRNDLSDQLEKATIKLTDFESQMEKEINGRLEERQRLGQIIVQLKDQLQINQVNYVRQRDRFEYWGADIEKENILLKTENKRFAELIDQNNALSNELRKLRDLLIESSHEIQRSKEQITRMSFDRDSLAMKLDKFINENERLYRLNREMEEESLKWRNTYYTQRVYR